MMLLNPEQTVTGRWILQINDAQLNERWARYYSRRRRGSKQAGVYHVSRYNEVNKIVPAPKYEPMPYDVFMAARIADYEIGQ